MFTTVPPILAVIFHMARGLCIGECTFGVSNGMFTGCAVVVRREMRSWNVKSVQGGTRGPVSTGGCASYDTFPLETQARRIAGA